MVQGILTVSRCSADHGVATLCNTNINHGVRIVSVWTLIEFLQRCHFLTFKIRFLSAFVKLRHATICFIMFLSELSVLLSWYPSVRMEQVGSTYKDFVTFDI
jgi:hypothetical protein